LSDEDAFDTEQRGEFFVQSFQSGTRIECSHVGRRYADGSERGASHGVSPTIVEVSGLVVPSAE
jgi:hypothetical protein